MDESTEALLGQLRHDLGKYVAFQLRWLPASPEPDALLEALRADLLQTRRGPDGAESAAELWARYRDRVAALPGTEAFVAGLDTRMARILELAPALRAGSCSAGELAELAELAHAVAAAVRELHRSARGGE